MSAPLQKVSNASYSAKTSARLTVDRAMIYEPSTEYTYSHHPHIAWFHGQFVAIWSNHMVDEDAPGQRVLLSTSPDCKAWSKPIPLAEPDGGGGGVKRVLTAAGFHEHGGVLVAYYGQYDADRTNTHLRARTTRDLKFWGPALDMEVPVNPNHGPTRTRSGRLIIAGNFAFPYTDDPSGLTGWKWSGFQTRDLDGVEDNPATFWGIADAMKLSPALCEGSFVQTADGALHMLLRATGSQWRGHLWETVSTDDGATWGRPRETEFTDNDAKFHLGRLPNGLYYYVGNPDNGNHGGRNPLVLSTSRDGLVYDRHYIVADDRFTMKKTGRYKGGDFGYPHSMVHDGHLYIIVSRQKEAVEVFKIDLAQLERK